MVFRTSPFVLCNTLNLVLYVTKIQTSGTNSKNNNANSDTIINFTSLNQYNLSLCIKILKTYCSILEE